ncbi:MAG: hypothetical protein QGG08_05600 [Candidatus Poseidoniia archaeon]|jgi:hypothetical protein|nr:hypothetical protein [Candidatus Poseidoniia archaeon]|tara:strand:+ start:205 stop:405 length:201 start_codon:yes stop_codon:yes gene_type:complete
MNKTFLFLVLTIFASSFSATDQANSILSKPIDTSEETNSRPLPASSFDPADIQSQRLEKLELEEKE